MTRVSITVDDQLLGDVSVEQNDHVGSYSVMAQREAISILLARANAQIDRAYQLTNEAAQ